MATPDKPTAGTTGTTVTAAPQLSAREIDIAIHGIACLRDNAIDPAMLAQLTGYKTEASARARWSELRQKLAAHYAQSGIPGVPIAQNPTNKGPATPRTKKTPLGKKRTRKVAFSGSDGSDDDANAGNDGDDSPARKRAIRRALTPKRRKAVKGAAAVPGGDKDCEKDDATEATVDAVFSAAVKAAALVAAASASEKVDKDEDDVSDEAGEDEKVSA